MKKFGISTANRPVECLGMAQVLDPEKILKAFALGVPFQFEHRKSGWQVKPTTGAALQNELILSERELTRLFFSAAKRDPSLEKLFSAVRLPLSLWVWGLDAA